MDIQVRQYSRDLVVLTFPSKEDMVNMLCKGEALLREKFSEVKQWKAGMKVDPMREVWISCFGIPLNLWNPNTFF